MNDRNQDHTDTISRRSVLRKGTVATGALLVGGTAMVGTAAAQQSISCGQTINGELTPGDSHSPPGRSGNFAYDTYEFSLDSPTNVRIDMKNGQCLTSDTYLLLFRDGTLVEANDDAGGRCQARINKVLSPGDYTIYTTSFAQEDYFSYSLSLACLVSLEDVSFRGCSEVWLAFDHFTVSEYNVQVKVNGSWQTVTINQGDLTKIPGQYGHDTQVFKYSVRGDDKITAVRAVGTLHENDHRCAENV